VVDPPDLKGRETILRVHTQALTVAHDLDLTLVAARTSGFVGADLANLANEAALAAARRGKQAVGLDDFDEAIDRVVAGLERRSRVMNARERELIAYHEAGHGNAVPSSPGWFGIARVQRGCGPSGRPRLCCRRRAGWSMLSA
jgi:cell division protease FtsH